MNARHTVISVFLLLACLTGNSVGATESTTARSATPEFSDEHTSELLAEKSTPTDTVLDTTINTQTTLADRQWKNRLIIAFALETNDQTHALGEWVHSHACELYDRDILVFVLTGSQSKTLNDSTYTLDAGSIQQLIQRRQHANEPFELMLVGKDGGTKANATSANAMQGLIKQIDGMPMRRSEASRRSSVCNNDE